MTKISTNPDFASNHLSLIGYCNRNEYAREKGREQSPTDTRATGCSNNQDAMMMFDAMGHCPPHLLLQFAERRLVIS